MRKTLSFFALPFLVWSLFLNGCGRDLGTAQGVADEFVDQHYVNFDLQKAKAYAVSVALDKVNEEIRLTAGQKIDMSTQQTENQLSVTGEKRGRTTCVISLRRDDSIRRRLFVYPQMVDRRPQRGGPVARVEFYRVRLSRRPASFSDRGQTTVSSSDLKFRGPTRNLLEAELALHCVVPVPRRQPPAALPEPRTSAVARV